MRILFLIPHPQEGASSRYRVLQYVPHFEARGIRCTVSSFLSPRFYQIAYQPGRWIEKTGRLLLSSLRRLRDVARSRRYDAIFIHWEAFPLGPPWVEEFLSRHHVPFIFDMDDAIFLPRNHDAHPVIQWLRMPQKLPSILRWSRHVITGNDYLRRYAQQFTPRVSTIPTCVDTRQFTVPADKPQRQRPVIGWIGSHSTFRYLEILKPVLRRIADRHPFIFKIVGVVQPFRVPGVEVVQEPWTLATDVAQFQDLDIGVYPLPDDPWVLGKAGFKAIQYMAVGVPCVASGVGRTREIIQDGVNGLLAHSAVEWYQKLESLLTDPALRMQIGLAGRRTVEREFATARYISAYVDIFQRVAGRRAVTTRDPAQDVVSSTVALPTSVS